MIGDSIIKNFLLYPHIWQHYFTKNIYLNCGISGDSTQHVLWRAKNLTLPSTIKNVFILCGSNNVNKDSPIEIVNGIVSIGLSFIEQYKNIQVFLSGIIPRDSAVSVKRDIIYYINHHIEFFCSNNKGFYYVNPGKQWTNKDNSLKKDLFFKDNLHLIEKGYVKLSESIIKAFQSASNQLAKSKTHEDYNVKMSYHEQFPPLSEEYFRASSDGYSNGSLPLHSSITKNDHFN